MQLILFVYVHSRMCMIHRRRNAGGGGGGLGPPFPTKDLFLFPTPMRLMTVTAATDEIYSFLRVLLID